MIPAATLARSTDPNTSHAAAQRLGTHADTMRASLLAAFATAPHFGLTAEEAADKAGYTPADGAWKRVSDLTNAGLIVPTAATRRGSSGRQQRVLRITAEGREALA